MSKDQSPAASLGDLAEEINTGPARTYYGDILTEAVSLGASDLHFEVGSEGRDLHVRARVDGVMQKLQVVPERHRASVMAVLKLELEGMDVSDTRRLQNGRFSKKISGKMIDFRGATWMTQRGEEMTIRLLEKTPHTLELDEIFAPQVSHQIKKALTAPFGLMMVTGPTGSGKTTVQYAMLQHLAKETSRKLMSVEDPIESNLENVSQAPVIAPLNRSFPELIRQALRSDPDVLMIGEIREEQTANLAVRAANSGHLVLSTSHAMSGTLAMTQLSRMGVPGYQVAQAVKAVVSVRLMRRLCSNCSVVKKVQLALAEDLLVEVPYQANAEGCRSCHRGYKGRVMVADVLDLSGSTAVSLEQLRLQLQEEEKGTPRALAAAGAALAEAGESSADELRRVMA